MADTTENCDDDDIGVLMPNVMKLLHAEIISEVSFCAPVFCCFLDSPTNLDSILSSRCGIDKYRFG